MYTVRTLITSPPAVTKWSWNFTYWYVFLISFLEQIHGNILLSHGGLLRKEESKCVTQSPIWVFVSVFIHNNILQIIFILIFPYTLQCRVYISCFWLYPIKIYCYKMIQLWIEQSKNFPVTQIWQTYREVILHSLAVGLVPHEGPVLGLLHHQLEVVVGAGEEEVADSLVWM